MNKSDSFGKLQDTRIILSIPFRGKCNIYVPITHAVNLYPTHVGYTPI